ncbi:MAG: indolepyruvate ferredoxin oxidoreductase subunit alpha [Clostridia bacterium]|nr:indolepyruvate ferredoxin oxidoreductase subunit alpha [Clostridia bacterium]
MKKLLFGNEAVARGLWEAGCGVVSSYPGTPSTEITEYFAKYDDAYAEWAPNEKVAMEVAFGASLRGVRSACAMKHVGLNVAADPLFTLSYTGVNGGLVVCVADDPAMHSSQNEQDSRHYAIGTKIPMLEPADSAEALEFARAAFDLSEEYDTPVILRMCTRIAHSRSLAEVGEKTAHDAGEYTRNPAKYVMVPANAKKRHPIVEERTRKLVALAENCAFNKVFPGSRTDMGIITSGTAYQYVREVFGDTVPVMKLGLVNPLPEESIRDFAAKVDRLVIVEELDGIIESHVKNLGIECEGKSLFSPIGELSQKIVADVLGAAAPTATDVPDIDTPARPPQMCAGCPHRGLFYAISKMKLKCLGDIGCYTLGAQPPLSALDSTLCMGASISGLHGFVKADPERAKDTVCVIGDSTFMHSGITGLADIVYNDSKATVIILDNSITGMTGHQQNPTTGYTIKGDPAAKIDLEALCRALGVSRVRVVDPYDIKDCETALKEELAADEASVIISRRPCILLKNVKKGAPLRVDSDKCKSCKMCMKLGCPAISLRDGKAKIDDSLCTGCKVCASLCPFDAIME